MYVIREDKNLTRLVTRPYCNARWIREIATFPTREAAESSNSYAESRDVGYRTIVKLEDLPERLKKQYLDNKKDLRRALRYEAERRIKDEDHQKILAIKDEIKRVVQLDLENNSNSVDKNEETHIDIWRDKYTGVIFTNAYDLGYDGEDVRQKTEEYNEQRCEKIAIYNKKNEYTLYIFLLETDPAKAWWRPARPAGKGKRPAKAAPATV